MHSDGGWDIEDQSARTRHGRISHDELHDLNAAISSATVGPELPEPHCQSAADGQDITYTWFRAGEQFSVMPCREDASNAEHLIALLDDLARG